MESKSGTYQGKQVKPFLKPLIIVSSILLIGLSIFGIRMMSNNKKDQNLIKAAKSYYKKYSSILPKEYGECSKLEINELVSKEYLKSKDYYKCDREKTYVQVCKLKSKEYQYTPYISCGDKNDIKYDKYKEGKESDLTPDVSDVRFSFLPQMFSNKIKNYYPEDKTDTNEVQEYYATSPAKGYVYREVDGVVGYKWYSKDSGTNYWNNGEYTSEKPDGYNAKGEEGEPVTHFQLEIPEKKDYRTINEAVLYRTKENTIARPFKYVCIDPKIKGNLTSRTKCEERNSNTFLLTLGVTYTCDDTNQVPQNTVCSQGVWSDWTNQECTTQGNIECESKKGYSYTDRVWKWYLEGDFRKYYPSGNASSKEENTYYASSPKEGYIKDEKTKKKVYKYFKLGDDIKEESSSWIVIDSKFLTQQELFEKFKEFNFDVQSLSDIVNNKNIQYETKLEYRNRR